MEIPTINKQSLMKMKVGDSMMVSSTDTILREVFRVPKGFIYLFLTEREENLHTQFVPIEAKDIPDMREFF